MTCSERGRNRERIGGEVDEGYGKVADAFRRNFSDGKEIGKAVGLWGGERNAHPREPCQQDTIVNVFSTTKGVASLAVVLSQSVRDALEAPAVPPTRGTATRSCSSTRRSRSDSASPHKNSCSVPPERAYGWPGLGGSFGFADPDTGVGFGYVPIKLGYHAFSDPWELALRRALFRDVLGAGPQA